MKIDEAVKIINGARSVLAKVRDNDLLILERNSVDDDWFLRIPFKAATWYMIIVDWCCLNHADPKDLARVMDVIQRLLDTPVEERFPEKKYVLPWLPDDESKHNYLRYDGYIWGVDDDYENSQFAESELEKIKHDNPSLANVIDLLKKEV